MSCPTRLKTEDGERFVTVFEHRITLNHDLQRSPDCLVSAFEILDSVGPGMQALGIPNFYTVDLNCSQGRCAAERGSAHQRTVALGTVVSAS